MKLAILGSGPIALEAALEFHFHGAAVTWFNAPEIEPESYFDLDYGTHVSDQGKKVLSEMGVALPTKLSWAAWKELYSAPLELFLGQQQLVKPHQIVSITKRFLAPGEKIQGKSRFLDLFRLTYQINPAGFIQEQQLHNPETFERLTSEFIQSLQSTLEMYEDFDLVFDFRRATSPTSMAITGRALGESRISKDKVHYGFQAVEKSSSYILQENVRELALVGSGLLAGEILLKLSDWLKDPRSRLFVASAEVKPFEQFLNEALEPKAKALLALFDFMEAEFESEVIAFHYKLREWQALDDFVQVKISKPVEPIPRLVYFSGHNTTAVDQLIDRNRLFLTLEKPEFRAGLKHHENNILELKTIGVDEVLVASSLVKPPMLLALDEEEVGFFSLEPSSPLKRNGLSHDLLKLKGITNEIFKLFSPTVSD